MSWYGTQGEDRDVVLSSRVRLARNIENYPMGELLSRDKANEIIVRTGAALGDEYERVDFTKLDYVSAAAYVEEHLVSADFAKLHSPHALYKCEHRSTYIMVCEEDHLRIQSITAGFSPDAAYAHAAEAADKLAGAFDIAFDDKLGYLTHCPTNLGTGMRVSLMMFLPALTKFGQIPSVSRQLGKLGVTVRGMYGEGSEATGCLYQISNQVTLGISEEETVSKLKKIAASITESERKMRRALTEPANIDETSDSISRAYGTLLFARKLSGAEFMRLWVRARLGISLCNTDAGCEGLLPDSLSYEKLDTLLIEAQPAVLTLLSGGGELSPQERDIKRSALVRTRIN